MKASRCLSISVVLFAVLILPTLSCTTVVRDYPDADAGANPDPYGGDAKGSSGTKDTAATGNTPDTPTGTPDGALATDGSLPDAAVDASPVTDGGGVNDTAGGDTGALPVDATVTDAPLATDADAPEHVDSGPLPDTALAPCDNLATKFEAALPEAKACTQTSDCHFEIAGDIEACACDIWVTAAGLHAIETLQGNYADTCGPVTCEIAGECPDTSKPLCKNGVCIGTAAPQTDCANLEAAYKAEIGKAKACTDENDCSVLVDNALGCGCDIFVSSSFDVSAIVALQTKYAAKCTPPTGCAPCGEPLSGSCTNMKCITELAPP